ncbi:S-layer homology domain-containing protein [Paenibacillus thermotolerans]|uniref:S-layer homology domain-containing protein n=1 Tax=Paenibacillus thermotolerans TaxID=3027807 RepID=UPI0023685F61|nr:MULTISPECIES: S-layer homology domain-containing protein [unclassified Paenibacillus]
MYKPLLAAGLALLLSFAAVLPAAAVAADAGITAVTDLQCFADQKSAKKKGKISYHILAHAVSNKNFDKAWVKVLVPGGVEVDGDLQGGVWDQAEGTVKWNVKGGLGADVFHLNVKVREDVGEQVKLGCVMEIDGKQQGQVKDVAVTIGTEVHQPVFNGYPDGTFRPKSFMTRAEAATIVARELNLTDSNNMRTFKDIRSGHWAKPYIEKTAGAGYMVGDGERFRPDEPITLAEWIAITLRIKGVNAVPANIELPAKSKGKWYENDAKTAIALGYFRYNGEDVFESAVPRDIVAQLFAIALQRGELTDGQTKVEQHWPDVPKNSPWFGWVEEMSYVAHESEQLGLLKEALVKYLPDQTEPF